MSGTTDSEFAPPPLDQQVAAAPYTVCPTCGLVYPSAQSWEVATRPVSLVSDEGVRTRSDVLRLCPCGAPMVRP